jgi:hypothetical protein
MVRETGVAGVQTAHQRVDNKHLSGHIIVLSGGDDVPQLAGAAIALRNLDGVQIGAEISRKLVNEETLSRCSLPID